MALLRERDPDNAPGPWYVDTRCIGCDVSRHHTPDLIDTLGDGRSVVARQPESAEDELLMWRAALACPTRSIGTVEHRDPPPGVYPWEVTDGVLLCGHNDRRSYGAHSWFMPRAGGGFLFDAPHWDGGLVTAIEARGGLAHVLLSHRDDIADAERYADRFDARVWIHEADAAAAPFATDVLRGDAEQTIAPGLVVFPVPGHTRGSVLYLVDELHLFTGDTVAWMWRESDLGAFRGAAWYSWDVLRDSLARFAASSHRFAWIWPGHGKWHGSSADDMHQRLRALVDRM